MELRDYQQEAVDRTKKVFQDKQSALAVMATGLGKTIYFSHMIKDTPGRAMVIAHRGELIHQAHDKIRQVTGIEGDIEMARDFANRLYKNKVVIGTVQTLTSGRFEDFNPNEFSLLVIDEAHHSTSPSYRRVIDHFKQSPGCKILGVTATPDRTDEEALGQIFDDVSCEFGILEGINNGWLVPIQQNEVFIDGMDLSSVKTSMGDLATNELSQILEFEENLHGVADPLIEIADGRKCLVFTASVAQAERLAEIFNRHQANCADYVTGKTPKDIRQSIFKAFAERRLQYLVNVGVACLDEETEILTSTGWKGIDSIDYYHKVACWENGKIEFAEPLAIEKRKRKESEKMICLETKNRSIRVTDDHRMVFKDYKYRNWEILTAKEIVGRKCHLPVSGYADPFKYIVHEDKVAKSSDKRRIQSNSYKLRKTKSMSYADSIAEAKKRIDLRNNLKRKQPEMLSLDECSFIGFFVGDGTITNLSSGGIEYSISQPDSTPNIQSWFDTIIKRVGYDALRKHEDVTAFGKTTKHVKWSFSRGTGFGPQNRKGLYEIEPYLDKNGSRFLWGLNWEQFRAFLQGLWMADGEHGNSKFPISDRFRISKKNTKLLDLLQAIAVCRGYRASIGWPDKNGVSRISISLRDTHHMTKYTLQPEVTWKNERVWCVKSKTGLIVTRRNGTVTVTGNTEGFDDPDIDIVANARPTKSRCLYTQMSGRGTRPHGDIAFSLNTCSDPEERKQMIARSKKPSVELIDFVGNSGRHKLVNSTDILGGKYTDDIVDMARLAVSENAKDGKPTDIITELKKCENEMARRRRAAIESAKRGGIKLKATFSMSGVDPFDVLGIVPCRIPGWSKDREPTDAQRKFLERRNIKTDDLNFTHASQLIGAYKERMKNKWPFGRHEGKDIKDVPRGYLKWWVSQSWASSKKELFQQANEILYGKKQEAPIEPVDDFKAPW